MIYKNCPTFKKTNLHFPFIQWNVHWSGHLFSVELICLETEEWDDGDEVEGESHEGGIQSAYWVQEGTRDEYTEQWLYGYIKGLKIQYSMPGKGPKAHSNPEVNLTVRDEVKQGRKHGAQ